MNPLQTGALTRQQIGDFIQSPRGVRAFEAAQADIKNQYDAISGAAFLTLTDEPTLGAERVFTPEAGELVGTDAGANGTYTLSLADTGIVAGSYGDASNLVTITVDTKGRATALQSYVLNSDNVTEGSANLFFTNARARAALSGGTGISYNSGTGAIALDTADSRNVDHSAISVNAGSGLTGGGDLTATRTISLAAVAGVAGTHLAPTSITVDGFGRITAIS